VVVAVQRAGLGRGEGGSADASASASCLAALSRASAGRLSRGARFCCRIKPLLREAAGRAQRPDHQGCSEGRAVRIDLGEQGTLDDHASCPRASLDHELRS
jgi:hypothetical protein